jgi:hypothetical protein
MKTTSQWRHRCRPIIRDALAALPEGSTRGDAERALSPLYPFGERAHHPYAMWRAEARAQLDARFGRRAARAGKRAADVVLTASGVCCRVCPKLKAGSCILCGPHRDRWRGLSDEARREFGALMKARGSGQFGGGIDPAADWAEEHMGGLPVSSEDTP